MEGMEKNPSSEIDLRVFLSKLISYKYIVIAILAVCTAAAYLYTVIFMTPTYSASSQLHLMNVKSEGTTSSEISSFSYLSKDFVEMMKGTRILKSSLAKVKGELSKEYSVGELKSAISVENRQNTRLIDVDVTVETGKDAQILANAVASIACDTFNERYKMEIVYISETSETPGRLSGPDKTRNALLGFVVGLALSAGMIIVLGYADDRLKSAEDIERYLGMSTLATIPYNDENNTKKKGARK